MWGAVSGERSVWVRGVAVGNSVNETTVVSMAQDMAVRIWDTQGVNELDVVYEVGTDDEGWRAEWGEK